MLRRDTIKFQGARKLLVDKLIVELENRGLKDQRVIDALLKVPRHVFFDSVFDERFAYENTAFSIGAGQTISQPLTVAVQSSLLEIKKRDKVLEIGTGSGYQTAILLELGARVFSIERQKLLYDKAVKVLPEMGYNPRLFYGDGFAGKPAYAPFDKMIITCGAPNIPPKLVDQLKVGGIMIIPVGEGDVQKMYRMVKQEDGSLSQEYHGEFSFVPMLQNVAR